MKTTIGRIFDSARALATKPGQELQEMILFLSDFAEQALRALRNGVSLGDNIDCKVMDLILIHNTTTQIDVGTRKPVLFVPSHVLSDTSTLIGIASYAFGYNNAGVPVVNINFTDTTAIKRTVRVAFFY